MLQNGLSFTFITLFDLLSMQDIISSLANVLQMYADYMLNEWLLCSY